MSYRRPNKKLILAASFAVILAAVALGSGFLTSESLQTPLGALDDLLRTGGVSGNVDVSIFSDNSGQTVGLVSVDRPVDGEVDGLPELVFVILEADEDLEALEVLSDSVGPGTVRFLRGEFLEISQIQSDLWVLALPYGLSAPATQIESVHMIQVADIFFSRSRGRGTPGRNQFAL